MIDSKILEAYKEMKKDIALYSKEEYRDMLVDHLLAILGWRNETPESEMSDETYFFTELIELFCIDKIYQLDHDNKNEVNHTVE